MSYTLTLRPLKDLAHPLWACRNLTSEQAARITALAHWKGNRLGGPQAAKIPAYPVSLIHLLLPASIAAQAASRVKRAAWLLLDLITLVPRLCYWATMRVYALLAGDVHPLLRYLPELGLPAGLLQQAQPLEGVRVVLSCEKTSAVPSASRLTVIDTIKRVGAVHDIRFPTWLAPASSALSYNYTEQTSFGRPYVLDALPETSSEEPVAGIRMLLSGKVTGQNGQTSEFEVPFSTINPSFMDVTSYLSLGAGVASYESNALYLPEWKAFMQLPPAQRKELAFGLQSALTRLYEPTADAEGGIPTTALA